MSTFMITADISETSSNIVFDNGSQKRRSPASLRAPWSLSGEQYYYGKQMCGFLNEESWRQTHGEKSSVSGVNICLFTCGGTWALTVHYSSELLKQKQVPLSFWTFDCSSRSWFFTLLSLKGFYSSPRLRAAARRRV